MRRFLSILGLGTLISSGAAMASALQPIQAEEATSIDVLGSASTLLGESGYSLADVLVGVFIALVLVFFLSGTLIRFLSNRYSSSNAIVRLLRFVFLACFGFGFVLFFMGIVYLEDTTRAAGSYARSLVCVKQGDVDFREKYLFFPENEAECREFQHIEGVPDAPSL